MATRKQKLRAEASTLASGNVAKVKKAKPKKTSRGK